MQPLASTFSLIWRKATRIRQIGRPIVLLIGLVACQAVGSSEAVPAESPFDGQAALAHAAEQVEMGPRYPGSEGHRQVQEWIASKLEDYGWQVEVQRFQIEGVHLANFTGTRPSQQTQVLLGTHFDTRPVADQDALDPDMPVPGANDGASGVAVLLELARVMPSWDQGCRPGLVFFDAEDSGGLSGWDWHEGADYYVENTTAVPQALVVIDMIGDADLQIFLDINSDEMLSRQIWARADALGYDEFIPEHKYAMIDDHIPFAAQGVRSALLIDFDYPFWHTTGDTMDKISADSLEAVGRTVQQWLLLDCPELLTE